MTYLTSLRSGIGDHAAVAIAGMEHSAMRVWKKPADDSTFVMWTVTILFVLGLLSIVSGVPPVVDNRPKTNKIVTVHITKVLSSAGLN